MPTCVRLWASIAITTMFIGSVAQAAQLSGFGPPHGACSACESSARYRVHDNDLPEHAIVLEMNNGPFWQNDTRVVIDLDGAQAKIYRPDRDAKERTPLKLAYSRAIPPEVVEKLVRQSKPIWNPTFGKRPLLPIFDLSETLTVIDGKDQANWNTHGNDPAWAEELRKTVRDVAAPTSDEKAQ